MSDPKLSRGYRNRNPGNLNYIARNPWRGQVAMEAPRPGITPRFGVYDTHENGIRAIVCQLRAYQRRGKTTLREMISTWAPPGDNNDTQGYWFAMARKTGFPANTPFPLDNPVALKKLVVAIIEQELGGNPYTDQQIDAGIAAADSAAPSIVQAAKTGTGTAALQVGVVAGAAASAAPAVQALGGLHPAVGVAVVLAAVAVAVFFILQRRREQ